MVSWRSLLFGAILLGVTASAHAEECTQDAESCARLEFEAGIEAYKKQNYADAVAHFEAAQKLRPHPVILFNHALAESRLERWVAALAHFDQVLADPETPKDLLPEVENERAAALAKVGTLEIDAPEGAETFVDDAVVAGRPAVARVDPGEHRVRVVLDGKDILNKSLRVGSGERLRLDVDRPREVVVAPPPPKPPPPPPPPPPGPSPLWFYVGAGLTAVVGGVTVWSALDTQKAFDAYERDLPRLDQREVDARVSEGHDKELRTNLLIGATALAAAGTAAVGLFVVDWGSKKEQSGALLIGPGGLTAVGRF